MMLKRGPEEGPIIAPLPTSIDIKSIDVGILAVKLTRIA